MLRANSSERRAASMTMSVTWKKNSAKGPGPPAGPALAPSRNWNFPDFQLKES